MQDGPLGGGVRIVHPHMHEKAVELRLRERVGPLLLDRVLGRHHQEQRRQGVGLAPHRDLALAHCLQQRGLDLGRGAVHLVGEQQVMEDGAAVEAEAAVVGAVDLGAGEVRGQQVRGELDPVEVTLQAAGELLDRGGLG